MLCLNAVATSSSVHWYFSRVGFPYFIHGCQVDLPDLCMNLERAGLLNCDTCSFFLLCKFSHKWHNVRHIHTVGTELQRWLREQRETCTSGRELEWQEIVQRGMTLNSPAIQVCLSSLVIPQFSTDTGDNLTVAVKTYKQPIAKNRWAQRDLISISQSHTACKVLYLLSSHLPEQLCHLIPYFWPLWLQPCD